VLYIQGVNQPKLACRAGINEGGTSRGKGNLMRDHARHEPGSTQSHRTAVPRSVAHPRRFQTLAKSTYKIQTKCIQNRRCNCITCSASMAYNLNVIKCRRFTLSFILYSAPAILRSNGVGEETGLGLVSASPHPLVSPSHPSTLGLSHLCIEAWQQLALHLLYKSE
jgi:hypothetical protein